MRIDARPGDHVPSEPEVLRAMLELDHDAAVASMAGQLDSWNRTDVVAQIVGDLVARGLAAKGATGGYRLTDAGERAARRSRGPFS